LKNLNLFLLILSILFCSSSAIAQSDEELLVEDMLLIAENFATPGAEAAAVQSSAGWFSSAQDLGKWKIDLSVHANAVFVPSSKQSKLVQNGDFNILKVQDGTNLLAPTVFGKDTDGVYEGRNVEIRGQVLDFELDALDGLDKKVIIHPFPQLTIGLPYGTEIALRYVPEITLNDVGVSTAGVAIKHNFSQYIPRHRPEDFNISAVLAYSNIEINYAYAPIQINANGFNVLNLNEVQVKADIWMAQALASKLYDNFEVFGAVGLTNSNFDYALGGGGLLLPDLNTRLGALGGSDVKFKADLGFNLYFGKFHVATMLTAGSFFNANMGLHYRFN